MTKPLILTYGMGIGPQVSLSAVQQYQGRIPIVMMGREESLQEASGYLPPRVNSLQNSHPISWFPVSDDAEPAEVAAIRLAAEACLRNEACGMVTGPINKAQLVAQGFTFRGHTDFLGHLCNSRSVMAFTGGEFKVALVTTHIPLMRVAENLSIDSICEVVRIADRSLREDLGIESPRFGVCGLNPHAGENGVLGDEEELIITPACDILRQQGLRVDGSISAETAFLQARQGHLDMIVAMYHDQGLAPLKAVDFGRSVNWTLGLPIIRTSVDHGTADSLVGTGLADDSSMLAAIQLAEQIAWKRFYSANGVSHSGPEGTLSQM